MPTSSMLPYRDGPFSFNWWKAIVQLYHYLYAFHFLCIFVYLCSICWGIIGIVFPDMFRFSIGRHCWQSVSTCSHHCCPVITCKTGTSCWPLSSLTADLFIACYARDIMCFATLSTGLSTLSKVDEWSRQMSLSPATLKTNSARPTIVKRCLIIIINNYKNVTDFTLSRQISCIKC